MSARKLIIEFGYVWCATFVAGAGDWAQEPHHHGHPSGRRVMVSLPPLTLDLFHDAATSFSRELSATPLPDLYGATDGKAVGTRVEALFKQYLEERYEIEVGNAALGLDFPSLNTDLKVTSARQPQSSCPFRSATQKIYGLGYNLLVVVYVKRDVDADRAAYLDIQNVIYIDQRRTSDFTLTTQIREIVENTRGVEGGREIAIEELDALMQDKNVPVDEVGRRQLAERIVDEVPAQGVLTISNALQWRLQYARVISTASQGLVAPEVVELNA